MSYIHCPYCEIKEKSNKKDVFKALQPVDGKCPDCGAWIDAGQHTVVVNGYADIYKGALRLLDEMANMFNRILYDCDIDLKDYFDEDVKISLYTSEIIESLFTPYAGGTTKSNLANALEIEEDIHSWTISKYEVEE